MLPAAVFKTEPGSLTATELTWDDEPEIGAPATCHPAYIPGQRAELPHGWTRDLPGGRRSEGWEVLASPAHARHRRHPMAAHRRDQDGSATGGSRRRRHRPRSRRPRGARRDHVPPYRAGRRGVRRGSRSLPDRRIRAGAGISRTATGSTWPYGDPRLFPGAWLLLAGGSGRLPGTEAAS